MALSMAFLARTATVIIALGMLALPADAAKSTKKWLDAVPTAAKSVEIKGKTTSSNYYPLDKTTPVSVKVVGPGTLKVYTRSEIPGKSKETIYGLAVVRDGTKHYLISRSAKVSKAEVVGENKRIGESKTVTFKVPKGTHEYQFKLPKDSKLDGYARFVFAEKLVAPKVDEEIKYIPFLPRKFSEEVRIVVKEEEYIYYRVNTSKVVELEVIGPAKLKIVSRLEFTSQMHNDKPYRLQISNEKEIVQTNPLKGKISATASYRHPTDLVIGRGDTSFLKVPDGRHRYTFTAPDSEGSVLLRFYLPEKALGNEWTPNGANGKAEIKPLGEQIQRG